MVKKQADSIVNVTQISTEMEFRAFRNLTNVKNARINVPNMQLARTNTLGMIVSVDQTMLEMVINAQYHWMNVLQGFMIVMFMQNA
jgi:hypothetical protein